MPLNISEIRKGTTLENRNTFCGKTFDRKRKKKLPKS